MLSSNGVDDSNGSSSSFLQKHVQYKDSLVLSYSEACGCSPNQTIEAAVACLAETPVAILTNASAAWEGSGTGLGGIISGNVFDEIRNGRYLKVPVVLSMCRDEGTVQALGFNSSSDEVTSLAIYSTVCLTKCGIR